jgi:DeoR/GlpR family transcriptional regulator of sugar metabolism
MLPAVRQRRIIELLAEREYVTVAEVSDATGASVATTQRDLARLAAIGALTRLHGGATRPPAPRGAERVLAAHLTTAWHALDGRDLTAVETALHQALHTCQRLRRERFPAGPGGRTRGGPVPEPQSLVASSGRGVR